jgi:hypothetical protein
MPKFIRSLDKIQNELKLNSPLGESDNLSKDEVELVEGFYYRSGMSVWGPCVDKRNSSSEETKYVIAVPNQNYYGGIKNA